MDKRSQGNGFATWYHVDVPCIDNVRVAQVFSNSERMQGLPGSPHRDDCLLS